MISQGMFAEEAYIRLLCETRKGPVNQDPREMELASVPALVVNWAGSETTTAEEYLDYMGGLIDKKPIIEYTGKAYTPLWPDVTYMHEILGHIKVHWKEMA